MKYSPLPGSPPHSAFFMLTLSNLRKQINKTRVKTKIMNIMSRIFNQMIYQFVQQNVVKLFTMAIFI